MDLNTDAATEVASDQSSIVEVHVPNVPDEMSSISAAAKLLAEHRANKNKQLEEPAPQEAADETVDELPSEELEDNPEPVDEQPIGDETEGDIEPEADLPPIEAPGSWTQSEKERFASLPRETQEYISARERERDAAIRRSQNEVAEQRKAIESEQSALKQAREQYESALPVLLQTLQSSGEFADIQTYDDVERLARDDWPRYVQWDAHQKKIAAVQQEIAQTQQRQTQEKSTEWQSYAAEQDKLFVEHVPEIADPEKGNSLRQKAANVLREIGFTDDELAKNWNGQDKVSLRDNRLQRLILDAVRYRDAKERQKTALKKPVPPVQKPGTARAPGAEQAQVIKALEQKLGQTHSAKDAAALLVAKRQASRR